MAKVDKGRSPKGVILLLLVVINALILEQGVVAHPKWYVMLPITLPLLLAAVIIFKKESLR